jgi:hypothetical protein
MTVHNINQFYNIGYRGGSGGFVFLHFLMLSEHYYTNFGNHSISAAIDYQWNIKNTSEWKQSEIWPSNFDTVNTVSNLPKVLYFCNPSISEFENTQHSLFVTFKQSYNNIKDPLWPDIDSFDDFIALPDNIKTEMLTVSGTHNILDFVYTKQKPFKIWLYTDFNSQNELAWYKNAYHYCHGSQLTEKITNFENYTKSWKNQLVDRDAVYFLNYSDLQIKLQDWINDSELLVELKLIEKITQPQIDFLKRWKKLHPPELLKLIGIK